MKYLFYILLILASCQSKDKSSPLSGSWEFEKNELFPGVQLNAFQDSMLHMVEEQQKGLTLYFSGTNFKVTQLKGGKEEIMGEQPFELAADKRSLILKNRSKADDVFPIVELSEDILKLNMFNSQQGYLIFRRKK
ncbi:MAG: hypothetical protein ABIR30_05730 [Chitinophagaceae bacterium]